MRVGEVERPDWGLAERVRGALPLSTIEGSAFGGEDGGVVPVGLLRARRRTFVSLVLWLGVSAVLHGLLLWSAAATRGPAMEAPPRLYPVRSVDDVDRVVAPRDRP